MNSVHIRSQDDCQVLAIDQLAGGTAEDYEHHISDSIDRLMCIVDFMMQTLIHTVP